MSDTTVLYGIKNCDTVKKARNWLTESGVDYQFYDLRSDGLNKPLLQSWLDQVGPEQLINTRSTTWKQLPPPDQALAISGTVTAVVLANPTLIKRPVLAHGDTLLVGFKPEEYQALFDK